MILPLSKIRFTSPLTETSSNSSLTNFSSSSSFNANSLSLVAYRAYLSDYELITNPKYLRAQWKDMLTLTITLQSLELLTAYSKHLENQIEAQNKNRPPIPDYDFHKALPEFFSKTLSRLVRNIYIFLTKKSYEALCVAYLPIEIADSLTKDVAKSVSRKLVKYSQFEASQRIFYTCFCASILRALSLFTVDCGYAIYEHYFVKKTNPVAPAAPIEKNQRNKSTNKSSKAIAASSSSSPSSISSPVTWKTVLVWTGKRAIFHSLSILFFSGGYSVGLMIHTSYFPLWIATIFEALGATILNPILA